MLRISKLSKQAVRNIKPVLTLSSTRSFSLSPQLLDKTTPFLNGNRVQRPSLDDESFVGLTGGEIFHEMMLRHNVKVIFGYPGGAILPVYGT